MTKHRSDANDAPPAEAALELTADEKLPPANIDGPRLRESVVITEGRMSKGGHNPPNVSDRRTPAPGYSGGKSAQDDASPAIIPLSAANAKRLAAGMALFEQRFREAIRDRLWGRIKIEVPFEDGDARDILHYNEGRVRMQ